MIPSSTISAFLVAVVFTLVVPVVLMIILGFKKKVRALPLFLGAGAFFLSQVVLRIPLLNALSTQGWFQNFSNFYLPYIFVICLSAGLFEESARLGGAFLLKKHRTFKDTLSFGLGHAFCEVIILVGLSHISNIALCLLINSGNEAALAALPADTLETVKNTLMTLNPFDIFWGILERVSAVLFHVFATVLVFKGVKEKKARYYFLAIAAHTVFNLAAVLIMRYAGMVATELILLALALAAGFFVLKQKSCFDTDAEIETNIESDEEAGQAQ